MLVKRIWPQSGRTLPEPGRVLHDMEQLFKAVYGERSNVRSSGVFPALNVTRGDAGFHVRAELPGMKADQLRLLVERDKLTISGERCAREHEGVSYHRRERVAGAFNRTITLPEDFDGERVVARFVNGVLTISLPLAESARPRQIAILTR